MKWVNSAGGPLLLLAEDCLSLWNGTIGGTEEQSDYDRACLVGDLTGSISVGDSYGLILNDEPFQTTWLPSEMKSQGLMIRWKYAKDEESITRHLAQMPDFIFQPAETFFAVTCAQHVLFDAALPGRDFRKGEFLKIVLDLGNYEIRTGIFEPDSETALIVHKFWNAHVTTSRYHKLGKIR